MNLSFNCPKEDERFVGEDHRLRDGAQAKPDVRVLTIIDQRSIFLLNCGWLNLNNSLLGFSEVKNVEIVEEVAIKTSKHD